jgi:hypothetical protein
MKRLSALLILLAASAVALVGCADDGGDVTGSASASASSASSGCEVVDGTKAARDDEVHVGLDEWSVEPDVTSVDAGNIEFDASNDGEHDHELVIVQGAKPAELTVTDEGLDEDELPTGAKVLGEIEGFPGGDECHGTFELAAGDYTLLCNITTEDVGSHAHLGMVKAFTVK